MSTGVLFSRLWRTIVVGRLLTPHSATQTFKSIHSVENQLRPLRNATIINLNHKRWRKRGQTPTNKKDEDGDDEGDDSDDEDLSQENPLLVDDLLNPTDDGSQVVTLDLNSLRVDSFAKVSFGLSRGKAEEAFYKGDIFINGERPNKKSQDVHPGDEVDYIKNINQDDSKMVDIKRVQLVQLPDKADEHGRMKVQVRRWQDLTIANPARNVE